jgi:hypothetical protein
VTPAANEKYAAHATPTKKPVHFARQEEKHVNTFYLLMCVGIDNPSTQIQTQLPEIIGVRLLLARLLLLPLLLGI